MAELKSTPFGGKKQVDYYNYIDVNPLYLHNHKNYYVRTVNKIRSSNNDAIKLAQEAAQRYIDYLKSREEGILQKIGGEKILQLIMDETYENNENMYKVSEIMREVFGRNNFRFSISTQKVKKSKRYPGGIKRIFNITNLENMEKFSVALKYLGKDKETGSNIYDYEAAIKNIGKEGRDYIKALGESIMSAYSSYGGFRNRIKNLVEEEVIDSSFNSAGMQKFIKLAETKNPPSRVLLELIIAAIGPFITYNGIYQEAISTVYKDSVINIFRENFADPSQADKVKLSSNRKLIYKKGKDGIEIPKYVDSLTKTDTLIHYDITCDNNPITISRKVTNSIDTKSFKIQDEVTLDTIYNAFAKEDIRIAKVYKYLTINNAFWSSYNGFDSDVFNRIIRYMAFVFMSGGTNLGNKGSLSNNEFNSDKALYLVFSRPMGNKIKTDFLPMSVIFSKLLLGRSSEGSENLDRAVTITNTRRDVNDISGLWSVKEEATRQEKKKNNWTYELLSTNSDVESKAKELASHIIDSNRRAEIKIDFLDYLVTKQKRYGNLI